MDAAEQWLVRLHIKEWVTKGTFTSKISKMINWAFRIKAYRNHMDPFAINGVTGSIKKIPIFLWMNRVILLFSHQDMDTPLRHKISPLFFSMR